MVDEYAGEDYEVGALADAAQTPPFLTDRRVVVGPRPAPVQGRASSPRSSPTSPIRCPTTALVLVWEAGAVPKALLDAVKKVGGDQVDTSPGSRRPATSGRGSPSGSPSPGSTSTGPPSTCVADDARRGRRPARRAAGDARGRPTAPGAKLGADDVEPFLGEAGGVPPWELTDAIDRGDIPPRSTSSTACSAAATATRWWCWPRCTPTAADARLDGAGVAQREGRRGACSA